jgi:hypothetical protein
MCECVCVCVESKDAMELKWYLNDFRIQFGSDGESTRPHKSTQLRPCLPADNTSGEVIEDPQDRHV